MQRRLRAVSGGDEAAGADSAAWIGSSAVESTAEPEVIGAAAAEDPLAKPGPVRHLRLVDTETAVAPEPTSSTPASSTPASPIPASPEQPSQKQPAPAPHVAAEHAPEHAPEQSPEPSRRRHRRVAVGEELLTLLAVVAAGTAIAVVIDGVIGSVDGSPLIHPLVLLALPTWDLLPRNVIACMGLVAGEVAAIVGCWVLVAALGDSSAWRAAPAFGVACLIVGTIHVVGIAAASRRRRRSVEAD